MAADVNANAAVNPNDVLKPVDGAVNDLDDFLSLENFARMAIQALKDIPITPDLIANLIQFSNGLFGNLEQIQAFVNTLIDGLGLFLAAFPFGTLIPTLLDSLFTVLLAAETRTFGQVLLYKLWDALPKTDTDTLVVRLVESVGKLPRVVVSKLNETNVVIG